jgi:DNA-binding transcriptional LysR family regulator
MNLNAFDLNLLLVFDAVMQDRSVTRAGGRIGLSQPAMSHALNRLRQVLKDELFIRTPDGMKPTPRAEQLAAPVRNALSVMQLALEPETFIPTEADRQFVLAVNNYAAVVIAPPLAAAIAAAAPGVRVDLRPSGTLEIGDQLDHTELDLAIGGFDRPGERFACASILEDGFVAVMRQGHAAAHAELSADTFAGLPHLEISSAGEDTVFIDRWLAEHGHTRRVALRAPYLSAGKILAQSDMVATLSRRIAQRLIESNALVARDLQCVSPNVRITMLWHRHFDNHPAHRWLRDIILAVSSGL